MYPIKLAVVHSEKPTPTNKSTKADLADVEEAPCGNTKKSIAAKKKPRKKEPPQRKYISSDELHPDDVFCGCNLKWMQQRNQPLNVLIAANVDRYLAAKSYDLVPSFNAGDGITSKLVIVNEVIDRIQSSGGRFLEYDKHQYLWFILEHTKVQKKVAQRFRDCKKLRAGSAGLLSRQETTFETTTPDGEKDVTTNINQTVRKDAQTPTLPPRQAKKRGRPWKDIVGTPQKKTREKSLPMKAAVTTPNDLAASPDQEVEPACKSPTISTADTMAAMEPRKRQPSFDSKYLAEDELRPEDVFCVRKSKWTQRPGNQKFRELISVSVKRYLSTKSSFDRSCTASTEVTAKLVIVNEVIDGIESSGGRFLEHNLHQNLWFIMKRTKVQDKIREAFRRCHKLGASSASLLQYQQGEIETPIAGTEKCATNGKHRIACERTSRRLLPPRERQMRRCTTDKCEKSLPAQVVDATPPASPFQEEEPAHENTAAVMPPLESKENKTSPDSKHVAEDELRPEDVFCGRNREWAQRPGNQKLNVLIAANVDRYLADKSGDLVLSFITGGRITFKLMIVDEVIKLIQSSGGRFLEYDKHLGLWFIVEHTKVQQKVARRFRDCRKLRADSASLLSHQEGATDAPTDDNKGRHPTTRNNPNVRKNAHTHILPPREAKKRGRPWKDTAGTPQKKTREKRLPMKAAGVTPNHPAASPDQVEEPARESPTISTADTMAAISEMEAKKRQPSFDSKYLAENELRPEDVLCGRHISHLRPGNQQFRKLISANVKRYFAAKFCSLSPVSDLDAEITPKLMIVDEVIDLIESGGGRFLEYDKHRGLWFANGHAKVRTKVAQSFRYCRRTRADGVGVIDLEKSEKSVPAKAVEETQDHLTASSPAHNEELSRTSSTIPLNSATSWHSSQEGIVETSTKDANKYHPATGNEPVVVHNHGRKLPILILQSCMFDSE